MKFATIESDRGRRFGAVVPAGFVDLSDHFAGRFADLRALLAAEALDEARTYVERAAPIETGELRFAPLIPNLDARMFALGWSYRDHQIETGKVEIPEHPVIFSKHPQALVGHKEALVRPKVSERFDFEGEIVVVMGRGGRNIPASSALEHIAGYAIAVDGSVRDYQQHSVTAGKNFDSSSAFGPWLVTPDEIDDYKEMELVTRLNGAEMQRTRFGLLAWELADVIAYISTVTRLEPGDSISTGTPAGVGNKRTPPVYMKAGDRLEVEVSGIGTLCNSVRDED